MVEIRLMDWARAKPDAAPIRFEVFVREQRVPEEIELDEMDERCVHAVAFLEGRPIGTGRLLPDGHIGRMAVLKPWRGSGVGGKLLASLIERARELRHEEVVLSAQVHAVPFYLRHGFRPEGPEYLEAGIPHQAMRLAL